MKEHERNKPELLKQNDIVSFYHIQMPRWLFADNRYRHISLAAKVAYSLLLNRYQLSKMNGWINEDGEVYIIFTREELAAELQVGARKAIEVFKELTDVSLVWETRRGHNKANLIYLTRVVLSPEDAAAHDSAPFLESGGAKNAPPDSGTEQEYTEHEDDEAIHTEMGHAENAPPDTRTPQVMSCDNDASGRAINAAPGVRNPHGSYTYISYNDKSYNDLSPSVRHARARSDRRMDGEIKELDDILAGCDLHIFEPSTAKVFESAIERLFFCESYRIGGSILPRGKVRSHLRALDCIRLQEAEAKIARNTEVKIKNTTAYTMAVIFNAIWECESDVMLDPYLNSLRSMPPPGGCAEGRCS